MEDQKLSRRGVLTGSLLVGGGLLTVAATTNAQTTAPAITVIANFSALATTSATVGQVVYIKHHTIPGFGSGIFEAMTGSVTSDGGTKINSATSNIYWQRRYTQLTIHDFGAAPDYDSTAAIQNAIDTRLPFKIPTGTYKYDSLVRLDVNNITITGDGSNCTKLKFMGSGVAFAVGTTAGFRQGINLSGFTIEGNANTTAIVRATAIARSQWTDINIVEANPISGIGFYFLGCSLNDFKDLVCSQDRQPMTNPPFTAVLIEDLSAFGNSSNNTFTNLYAEGAGVYSNVQSTAIGIRITGGSQNTFIGGSAESCTEWGVYVSPTSAYNTFIGVGYENLNAVGGDIGDTGKYSQYLNCYGSHKVVLQGNSTKISGGIYERIQIDPGAFKNTIENVSVNYWHTSNGGFFDSGTGTTWKALWDQDKAQYIYPIKSRIGLSLPGSGVAYTNTTGSVIRVVVNGGNITGAIITRGTETFNVPFSANVGEWILAPTDELTLNYTISPTLFWGIPMNGFEA